MEYRFMVHLDFSSLRNRTRCMYFINKITSLQKSGTFGGIPDRNWIMASLLPQRKMSILDIGSCGFVFQNLLDREQTALYDYHIIDIDENDNTPDWIKAYIHDCNLPNYPVPDSYFDLIICSDVIEHIIHHEVLLDECKKKLKPDGNLFLTTPNYASLPSLRNLLLGRMLHNPCGNEREQYCFKEHVRYYTTASIIPYFRHFGLHTSHIILSGLTTDIPGKSAFQRFLISAFYNRLCCFSPRFSHQTMLLLQKEEKKTAIVKSPLIPVQR